MIRSTGDRTNIKLHWWFRGSLSTCFPINSPSSWNLLVIFMILKILELPPLGSIKYSGNDRYVHIRVPSERLKVKVAGIQTIHSGAWSKSGSFFNCSMMSSWVLYQCTSTHTQLCGTYNRTKVHVRTVFDSLSIHKQTGCTHRATLEYTDRQTPSMF